jgi:hypothetical protein
MNDGLPYYDAVVKDLFQKDHPSLLDQLTGGVKIKAFLNVDLAKVLERRADRVLLLADQTSYTSSSRAPTTRTWRTVREFTAFCWVTNTDAGCGR